LRLVLRVRAIDCAAPDYADLSDGIGKIQSALVSKSFPLCTGGLKPWAEFKITPGPPGQATEFSGWCTRLKLSRSDTAAHGSLCARAKGAG